MARMHIISGVGEKLDLPVIRQISNADLGDALRRGLDDFRARPSHYALLALIYPLIGIVLAVWMDGWHAWTLLYPLVGGFALIGPLAALPLYEISRLRERGEDPGWRAAFGVLRSPALGSIMAVGAMLFVLFTLWLTSAQALYESLFGAAPPRTFSGLLTQITTEPGGLTLLAVGSGIGALFALGVLCTSVIAFPLLLERDVGAYVAVETSFRAVLYNRVPLFFWGVIVGAGLFLASLPFFLGLAIALPIFGHSTWHLYRKLVEPVSRIRGA